MTDVEILKQTSASSINLLMPVDTSLKFWKKVLDILVCQLERLVDFLAKLKVPGVEPLSPSQALYSLRFSMQDDVSNVLDIPRTFLEILFKTINSIRTITVRTFGSVAYVLTRPASLVVGYTFLELNKITDKIQPYVPITLPKLQNPFDFDYSQFASSQPFTNFTQRIEPYLPFSLSGSLGALKSPFPNFISQGKSIDQLEKDNKELMDLLEKERQQHFLDLSKLTALEESAAKISEELEKCKREYDTLKEELMIKLAKEIQEHKSDVEQLSLQSNKDKVEAEEKLSQAKNDCDKQKRELQVTIDKLTSSSKTIKAVYEDKLQIKERDCKAHLQELAEQTEAARLANLELERLKADNEQQKVFYFDKMAKEREAHQKEIDEVLALRRNEKVTSDEKITQLNKDLTAQKQSYLDQIEKERNECTTRIEKLKLEFGSDKSTAEGSLTKTNEELEAQKQELLTQISKEREQYKQKIDEIAAKNREEKTSSDARIDQLTRDLEKQKQELVTSINKERESTQQQIQKALDAQKVTFDRETTDYKKQLQTLQTKYDELLKTTNKDKVISGTVNETSSKPAEPADTLTGPLQDTGFGKIFKQT